MGSKFGKLSSGGLMSKHGRDRILFVVAASVTLAMVIVFVVVANVKQNSPVKTAVEKTDPFEATSAIAGNGIPLLAPEKEVHAGTKLSEVKFKDVQWPRHQVPEGAIRNPAELANLYAKVNLPPGLPITLSSTTTQVINPDSATLRLTPGNRAVSFEIDETSGLEGHALPGTHVDVVLTHSENGNLVSSIIVQNARVLSYGGDTSSGSPGSSRPIRLSKTITLDVATGDALKISTGRQMGRLGLLMRAPDDNKAADIDRVDRDNMNRKPSDGTVKKPDCTRGKVKMGGKDFLLGCDGSMTPLSE